MDESENQLSVSRVPLNDGLKRRATSPDDCCRWCKSGWCTKHGTCEHELITGDGGVACELAL